MTQEHSFQQFFSPALRKRMLVGAFIALTLIVLFLIGGTPDPDWPRFWILQPLLIVPFAGACGGLFYHLMTPLRSRGGWKTFVAILLSIIVYVFGLWMGTVLGLHGTYWN